MGLLQKAVETYDFYQTLSEEEKAIRSTPLAPVGHTVRDAEIQITLNAAGKLIEEHTHTIDKEKIIIPATEQSENRSSTGAKPHPLSDNVKYYIERTDEYLAQLDEWIKSPYSHPFLEAIYNYVSQKTIQKDLIRCNCIYEDKQGKIQKSSLSKLIRWRIIGVSGEIEECWKNAHLQDCFSQYRNLILQTKVGTCQVTGEENIKLVSKHPKLIATANLISSDDNKNFTYRGRFSTADQALTVSYLASQKAHNALRWLLTEESTAEKFGRKKIICWNPQGKKVTRPTRPYFAGHSSPKKMSDYREALNKTLAGQRSALPENNGGVVIAAFDTATSGRVSLAYYNELMASDYLQRLHDWDEHCCWWHWNKTEQAYEIDSPKLSDIVDCAIARPKSEKKKEWHYEIDKRDLHFAGQLMQTLLSSRVDGMRIPKYFISLLIKRASNLIAFSEEQDNLKNKLLETTCAVIKKNQLDMEKEEISLALDRVNPDPSYQYGRVLAILEKAEKDTYDRDEKGKIIEKRETNAIRYQQLFVQHPQRMFAQIQAHVKNAYYPKLSVSQRVFYDNLIAECVEVIAQNPNAFDKPLKDTYILGYYLQQKELYTSNKKAQEDELNE